MDLFKIYKNLYVYFGPQYWWPRTKVRRTNNSISTISSRKRLAAQRAVNQRPTQDLVRGRPISFDYRFEICVGAILTQNTAWMNVEKAMTNLIMAGITSPQGILKCRISRLCKLIRSAGYFRQKCKKLKIFSKFLVENYNGDLNYLFSQKLIVSRQKLLSLWGIGPETADSIVLYAGGKPSFVIDTYTRRLCEYFGVHFKTYDEYKDFFERQLPRSAKLFNEYHALIVAWGKLYSKDKARALQILA